MALVFLTHDGCSDVIRARDARNCSGVDFADSDDAVGAQLVLKLDDSVC
ncbi:hypothetical protein [Trueperella pyogenes]